MARWLRLFPALLLTLVPVSAWAQAQPQVGIVTTLQGQATVSRVASPASLPLKFKDGIFERDKINTAEQSIVKVLMGGKAVITVRELSVLTITEELGKTTVNLESGRIAVSVAKQLMKPGDRFEVHTPNAVAAVRGTVFVVEVTRQGAQVGGGSLGANTQVTSVSGTVEVGSLGNRAQTALLTAYQSVGVGAGVLGRVGTVTPQAMSGLLAGFAHSRQLGIHGDTVATMAAKEQTKAEGLAGSLPAQLAKPGTSAGCGGGTCSPITPLTTNRHLSPPPPPPFHPAPAPPLGGGAGIVTGVVISTDLPPLKGPHH